MQIFIHRLRDARDGATAIEYGMILALIAIAGLGALQAFGGSAMDMWYGIRDMVVANMPNGG